MGAATGRATGGSKEVGTGADSQCPQRGTFTVVGDGFVRVALVNIHIYIPGILFIPRRWAPSLTIVCPLWSEVQDHGSPRDSWRREMKLRGLVRGVLLERAFPLRGLGPPRTERDREVASVGRSGPRETGSEAVQRQLVCTERK